MEKKYQNLYNLRNDIKSFNLRMIKENFNREHFFKCINGIELSDEVYNDIIQFIINEGNFNLGEFIKDVNLTIKERNGLFNRPKIKCVKNRKELIQYMRSNYPNYSILSNPIDNILFWDCTIKGYYFYEKLNEKIIEKLNLNLIIDSLNGKIF